MAYDNTITVTGNVTSTPELRYTASGTAIVTFGLAWNQKDKSGESTPHFFDVTAWGSLGESVSTSVTKGARVTVNGRLNFSSWETSDGSKRSKVDVTAEDVGVSLKWATVSGISKTESGSSWGAPVAKPQAATELNEEPFRVDAADWTPGMWGAYPTEAIL